MSSGGFIFHEDPTSEKLGKIRALVYHVPRTADTYSTDRTSTIPTTQPLVATTAACNNDRARPVSSYYEDPGTSTRCAPVIHAKLETRSPR